MTHHQLKKGAPLFPDPRGISDKKAREGALLIHRNPQRAFQLFHQASEYAHPGANFECGAFYERGIRDYLKPDLKEAARHYMLACFGGLPHARFNLAFLYERGAGGLKPSQDRCLQLLDAAAEAGHGGAASAIADRLFRGIIRDRATEVEDFPEEAIYYWLLAAKEGMPRAAMALSVVFSEGIIIQEPDHDLSSRFVELALMLWWIAIKNDKAASTMAKERVATPDGKSRAQSPSNNRSRSPANRTPENRTRSRTPEGKAGKKRKSDRVLRLPSYFNRCGAASLVRERVLNRLLAKGPLTVEEVLEKAKNRSGGASRRGGSSNTLQGPSPVIAMLEWLNSIKAYEHQYGGCDDDDDDDDGGGHGLYGGHDDISDDDGDDDPEGWERQVIAIGPRFTFRNPEVSVLVLKDFKKLGHIEAPIKRPELINKSSNSNSNKKNGDDGGDKTDGDGTKNGDDGSTDGSTSSNGSDGGGVKSQQKAKRRASQGIMFNPQQRLGTLQEQSPSFH